MVTMMGTATSTLGAVGVPGCVYRAEAPSTKATRPPMASRPWLVTVSSSTNRTMARTTSSSPAMLRGRLPKPMKARMMREGAQDAGHEVGVLELEEEPLEAQREQDEGDVRVGQQVQEPLDGFMADSVVGAPAVCERPRLPCHLTVRPSAWASRSSIDAGLDVDGAGGQRLVHGVARPPP